MILRLLRKIFKKQEILELSEKGSILIIEDNETDRAFISKVLIRHGYQVLTAEEGETGVEIARATRVDMILLDYYLPGITGIEVCRILKADEKTRHIPIVFLTVADSGIKIVACYDQGAEAYLIKPINAKILIRAIECAMDEMKS